MNRRHPLFLTILLSLTACGGGGGFGSAVEGFLGNIEKEATVTMKAAGTAKGSAFSGTYARSRGKATGDCAAAFRNYKVSGSGAFLEEEPGELTDMNCQQNDDKFRCTASDDATFAGSINADGTFSIATIYQEEGHAEKLKLIAKIVGKISLDGSGTGTMTGGFRYEKSGKAICKFEAPVQMKKKSAPAETAVVGSLAINYDVAEVRGSRNLPVVAASDDGRRIQLRAQNDAGEELTLDVESERASLTGKLIENTQKPISFQNDCTADVEESEGHMRHVKFRCSDRDQKIEGEANFTVSRTTE